MKTGSRGTENASLFMHTYRKTTAKRLGFILICAVLCIFVFVYSATVGDMDYSLGQVIDAISDRLTGAAETTKAQINMNHIIVDLRLPRIIGALVCGFGLAVCGTAMQSMLKNPLADPYTMGISSGAGFGAAIAIILGIELVSGGGIVFNAFVFAVIPTVIILFLSKFRNSTPTMMILCGISLMYLFNAMTQLFMLIADPEDLSSVYRWMVGSLDGLKYGDLEVILPITVIGSVYIQYMANQLNVMGIGDESARTLGVDVEKKRLLVLLSITLVAASIVSFTGIIGFVGLVAPHIVRTVIGSDNRYLIPAAGIFGALLLMVSDVLARTVVSSSILPVGVITSCIGGPLFMFLVLRSSREVWS